MIATVERIEPEQALRDMQKNGAILVCAYDNDEKFAKNHLEGALSLAELRARESALARDHELIFYCA